MAPQKPTDAASSRTERRSQPRYRFTAAADIVEEKSATRIEARIADISQRGCHVETECGFPLGTEVRVNIHKGPDSFVAHARVVSSSVKGMGLEFQVRVRVAHNLTSKPIRSPRASSARQLYALEELTAQHV